MSVRSLFAGDEGQKQIEEFIREIGEEIRTREVRQKQTEDKDTK